MSLNIRKVKLAKVKDGEGLEVVLLKKGPDGSPISASETHKALVTPGLKKAFDKLAIHYAILMGYVKIAQIVSIEKAPPEFTEGFHVHGYSYGNNEENPGITITANYDVPGVGGSTTGNTPYKLFDVDPEKRYAYMDELIEALQECDKRVEKYLMGEEIGNPAQQSLDFSGGGGDKVTSAKIIDPNEKVTDEGNLASAADEHKYANKDAMARVAEMGSGSAEQPPEKKKRVKKVAQSAEVPSGIKEEGEE